MAEWTGREKIVLDEINDWAEKLKTAGKEGDGRKQKLDSLFSHFSDEALENIHEKIDAVLFQICSFADENLPYGHEIEKILAAGRLFDSSVATIPDMRKLTIDQAGFIAARQQAKYRRFSLFEGALSGTGKAVFAAADPFFLLAVNLRAVQLTGAAYGFETKTPGGLVAALKMVLMAAAPDMVKYALWEELMDELEAREPGFYVENDKLFHRYLWPGAIGHAGKLAFLTLLRPKKRGENSWAGMAIGALTNYYFSKKVCEIAEKYYQYRFLTEKSGL
ncbi:EcsC family protein [Heyndrickxia coagulans]|uniref:EcsC family protein n=1 Tax=Heyndrickxia coagulans TaxID=1398 RepID=UPI00047AFEA7|nr:EcsC family protein [Heyndrickxia coagulans]